MKRNATTLQVTWDHPYPDCKQFSVNVNGMPAVINITGTNYTITGLTPDTEYNVTVVAMEGPLPDQSISRILEAESGMKRAEKGHNYIF